MRWGLVLWCLGMIICGFTTEVQGRAAAYCEVSSTVRKFLQRVEYRPERESFSEVRRKESHFRKHRIQKRAKGWPYNCMHVALNYEIPAFEHNTFICCNSCKPHFFLCTIRWGVGNPRCPSNAIRCIAKCIYKNRSQGKGHTTGGGIQLGGGILSGGGIPSARKDRIGDQLEATQCSTTKKYVGNSYCIERSCIPFKSYK